MATREGLTVTPLSKDPNIRREFLLGASGLVTQPFIFVSLTPGEVAVLVLEKLTGPFSWFQTGP